MKISNYPDNQDFHEIESLTVVIKAVPFEGNFVPAMVIMSPDDDYIMTIDELSCLMDGIEIAKTKVDGIIDYILKHKVFGNHSEEENDTWESDS